ncbi:MAG: LamG-like jellyroll fold domain-containing protein [Nitrososphaerota archaeon]
MPRLWPQVRETADVRKGLVLDLSFDWGDTSTTAFDRSGYGNHARIYGATWQDSPLGRTLFHDSVDDYTVITPFTVYGWNEITIAEWIYPYWPKANTSWSKFSMIGDYTIDYPSTFFGTDNRTDYTYLHVTWTTRKPDGTRGYYYWEVFGYRNTWVHVVRRFTEDREISFWVNGVKKYTATVPVEEKTVLEWNPDTATYPERYRRFVLGANTVLGERMKVSYKSLRIYDRALSENEIKRLYVLTRPRPWPRISAPLVQWGSH